MLYHLVSQSDWKAAQSRGSYRAESLTSEGFIHFSFGHQWRLTLQRYYVEREDLLLLRVDPGRLPAEQLRVENGFPHLYAEMPCAAVLEARPLPAYRDLTICLASAVDASLDLLGQVREQGAQLVVLPELPFQRWCPAFADPDPQDEDHDGARAERQGRLAAASGLWLLGGTIRDRRNRACLWDDQGRPRLTYDKVHLPLEPGFWEARHYQPGQEPPRVCDEPGFPLGVQICSDIQRPFGSMFLRHQGAGAILVPRATERSTFARWRLVMQAMARVSGCYVLSVNRPHPEFEVPLGGPSLVVGPDGEVLQESEETLTYATLRHAEVVRARAEYPGYLEVPADTYARAWASAE